MLIYFSILIRFVIGIEQLGDKVHHQKQHSHLHTPTGFHWTWVTPKWLACHHNQHKFCKLMNMRDYHLQQQPTTISNNHAAPNHPVVDRLSHQAYAQSNWTCAIIFRVSAPYTSANIIFYYYLDWTESIWYGILLLNIKIEEAWTIKLTKIT